jgi:hypothetical protein
MTEKKRIESSGRMWKRALTTSLVGYWKMDEASGNATDSSGNSMTLTDNGGCGTAAGKLTNARVLNTSTPKFFSRASEANLQVGGTDFTFGVWVYPTTLGAGTNPCIMAKEDSTSKAEFRLDCTVGSYFRWIAWDTTGVSLTGLTICNATTFGLPSINTWYYVVFGVSGTTMFISVNGGAQDTASLAAFPIQNTAATFCVGKQASSPYYFDGRVDGVGIWKRALSTSEITQLYNSGNGLDYPFVSGNLFRPSPLSGLGAGGPFFANPIGA